MKKKLFFSAAVVALLFLGGYVLSVQLRPANAEYAWLVFGPKAKVRVLVTVAGDAISLRHYEREEPTGREEQFKEQEQPSEITLADADGVTSYVIRSIRISRKDAKKGTPTELLVNVEIKGPVKYRQYSDAPKMASELKTAPVSHFHGPLTIGPVTINWKIPSDLALRRGEKGTDLRVFIGTMDAKRGCWVVVKVHESLDKCLFPNDVRPVADIEFPSKKMGDPPIKRRFTLDRFC